MRILFLTQVLPFPLDAGPKVRAYHVIRYLAEAGHEVHLLSFLRTGESDRQIQPLRRLCAAVETVPLVRSRLRDVRDGLHSLFTAAPFLVLRDDVAAMHRKLAQVAGSRSFDALHADQLWMAPYGMNGVAPGLRVLDQHNAVFMVPRRMADHQNSRIAGMLLRSEANKLAAYERDACRHFDRVVWVTEEDRRAVLSSQEERGSRDSIIPIAADPGSQRMVIRPQPFRVTFLGGMHWPPNREGISWFVEKVWPSVARQAPGAVLTLIGKGASAAISRPGERVDVAGYVADLQQYLSETAVFIVPLHSGAGMRVKILDAWCWGLPVVSTTVGAEGLKAVHGENALIGDEDQTFADAVLQVVHDPHLGQRLADNGRATVERHYDWKNVYRAWDRVYQS